MVHVVGARLSKAQCPGNSPDRQAGRGGWRKAPARSPLEAYHAHGRKQQEQSISQHRKSTRIKDCVDVSV